MILLLTIILANLCLAVLFKLFKKYQINNLEAIIINYITCFILGSLIQGKWAIPDQFWQVSWFPYSVFLGVFFIFGFNITAVTVQRFGMGFTSIMQKMSLILPSSFAILLYHESANPSKLFGLSIALIAIWMINFPFKDLRKLVDGRSFLLLMPIFVFLTSGLIEILILYLDRSQIVQNGDINFVCFIFGIAGITGIIVWLFISMKTRFKFSGKSIIAGILLGVPNFFSIYLLVYMLSIGWEGSVLFPLNNIGVLVLSSILGFIIFNEEFNKWKWTGLTLAIAAIYLISL
jgi:drug/metabolite transporter (DMT)-like permease